MNRALIFAVLSSLTLPLSLLAHTDRSPIDRYLETAKTIVVAKCVKVGPVNILLRADVEVQVLHVVKGGETLRTIFVNSQYGLIPGETYLLRTESAVVEDKPYFRIDSIDSAIQVWPHEDIALLKTLTPRIIVLRTMNWRVDTLESEIRRRTYELEALKESRKEN